MDIHLAPGGILPVLGGLLIALLGLLVLAVRPRRAIQSAFALYAVTFGCATAVSRLHVDRPMLFNAAIWGFVIVVIPISGYALLRVARLQSRVAVPWWRLLVPGLVLGALSASLMVLDWGAGPESAALFGTVWTPTFNVGWLAFVLFVTASSAAAAHLAIAARSMSVDATHQATRMSNAFAIYPALFPIGFVFLAPTSFGYAAGLASVTGMSWLAVEWLLTSTRSAVPKTCRNAALFPLALGLIGLLLAAYEIRSVAGYARILTVIALAYAILRHHALDIHAHLRLGISHSALATVFIVVFFVASEGAQHYFGTKTNSAYIGIAAAGALVFVLAPLQRVAERLAHAALPGTGDHGLAAFRALARRLSADGDLSVDDRRILAQAAQEMGIGAGQVHDVLETVRMPRGRRTKL